MAANKTHYTHASVDDFINSIENEQKKADSKQLIALMQKATGEKPKMFGSTIIGFGSYHYKYASGREGTAPLLGFSPRKAALSLYVYSASEQEQQLLPQLGKYTMGKACIYVKKLSDINTAILQQLMQLSIAHTSKVHTRL